MRLKVFIQTLLLILLGNISVVSFAQEDLMELHYNQFDVEDEKISYRSYVSGRNEAQQVFSALFLFYKEFISSQDIDACIFTPSCSVYAMESVKTLGVLEGLGNAFDRMMRCHSFGTDYYPKHPHTHKCYDPVEKKN